MMNFLSIKPVRLLLIFITLYLIGVPTFRLRQEIIRLSLDASWHRGLDENNPETKVFQSFIAEAQETLEKEFRRNLGLSGEYGIPKTLSNCKNEGSSLPFMGIGSERDTITVDFSCLRIVDFDTESTTPKNQRENEAKETTVFRRFEKLMIEIGSSLIDPSKGGVNVRVDHTKLIVSYLTGNLDFLNQVPGFRVDSVYMFHKKSGVIALYPAGQNELYEGKKIDYRTRPWYKGFVGKYESIYHQDYPSENTSGLSGIYVDITDNYRPNPVRSIWYRFKNSDSDYVLGIDFFIDKSGAFSDGNSWISLFWLSKPIEWIVLLLIALPSWLALSLLYDKCAKRFLAGTDYFDGSARIRFSLIKEYYATLNDESIAFSDTNVTINLASVQTSSGVKLSLQGTGFEGNIERIRQRNRQEEQVFNYTFDNQYSLKVGPVRPTHKAVQIWQAEREIRQGNSQIVGHMVADWKTDNTVNLWGELSIKPIFWNKNDNIYLPSFQRQLRDHLLAGETGEITMVPDTQYQKRQSIPDLLSDIEPDKLETVPELKQVIDNSFDLEQGRFFVSELETIETLYALGHVQAIYSIPFLRKLTTKGQLDFFKTTAMYTDKEEFRFVLEHEANHFKKAVYDRLNQSTQDDWKNESPFQIMVHQRSNTENVILEQEGFSLIYINDVLRFVLYSLSDDTYSGIGWVSWRKVDLEFFKTLCEYQLSKRHSVKTVKSYIDGH